MSTPRVNWIFACNSNIGLPDREVSEPAPVDADLYVLERQLFDAGYIKVKYLRKEWEKWAWPGGYPIYYICLDGGCLCADCANDNIEQTGVDPTDDQWLIAAADINYEDTDLRCCHCDKLIESAYGGQDSSDRAEDAYQQELESREEP